VAAAAHVSRATLYRYFPSKADLLQACGPPMADAKTHTTRERIIQATIQLVAERGLHASTLDAIAERAGISRSGLQWHYRNKDELIADVAKSVPALLTIAQMTDQPNANADCATQLHHVADVILGDAEIVRSVAPFLIVEMRQHAEVARLVSTHTLGPVLRHLIALFERHEQSGELRPGSAQARAQAFLGIVLSLLIVKPTFLTILLGDDATILHEQIDMLLHGILAHPQKDPA
jgi:AcrR family transcriptional regulator